MKLSIVDVLKYSITVNGNNRIVNIENSIFD